MLDNSLPLSGNTSAGANVLLQGVDPGFHNVPLHHINLKSNFVSGQAVVGVRPTLPVEDISLLFLYRYGRSQSYNGPNNL